MSARPLGDGGLAIGYGAAPEASRIELRPASKLGEFYRPRPDDIYWKIGVTLADLDLACHRLSSAGIDVSAPHQFQDIGYLCHLADPEGFPIELLQWDFQGRRGPYEDLPEHPLGCRASLGQVTLRVAEIEPALRLFQEALGMRLLSVQPVESFGFTLYFLALTEERPPNPELEAVENRPWLWKRPYAQLELQHLWGERFGNVGSRLPDPGSPGFRGLSFFSRDPEALAWRLERCGFAIEPLASGEYEVEDGLGGIVRLAGC